MKPALSLEGVSKRFCRALGRSLAYGLSDLLAEAAGLRGPADTLRSGEFWALRDVSFRLDPGQSLGLVGKNGSGKTTALRLMSGLIPLDGGRIAVRGRVAPLISLGAGFHPVLDGRENVEMNLCMLGLSRGEIRGAFEEIADFAELGAAMEAPLRTYSSGMQARLGFACAVFSRPDIILVDETLAVGDMRFRLKCYRKLEELLKGGAALVLVSHNPWALSAACARGVYLSEGRVRAEGALEEALRAYEADLAAQEPAWAPPVFPSGEGLRGLRILGASLRADGQAAGPPMTGRPAVLRVRVRSDAPVGQARIKVSIREVGWAEGLLVRLNNAAEEAGLPLPAGEGELVCRIPTLNLGPGHYRMKVAVQGGDPPGHDGVDGIPFQVSADSGVCAGTLFQPHRWEAG